MKVVRVIARDMQNRPRKAAVADESRPVEVVAEKWADGEWHPLYGLSGPQEIVLPRGFELNRDSLRALDEAK